MSGFPAILCANAAWARTSFEVASIKPNDSGSHAVMIQIDAGAGARPARVRAAAGRLDAAGLPAITPLQVNVGSAVSNQPLLTVSK